MNEVLCTMEGEVQVLTLNRPDKANAMNEAMQNSLVEKLLNSKATVIASSHSKIFSAGADLKEFSELDRGVAAKKRRELLKRTLNAILDFPRPLVVAVEGRAIGGGCMLAMLADELVMSETAELSLPEIKHGIPTPVGYVIVAARCGMPLARRMVQSGEVVSSSIADVVGGKEQAIDRARALAALWGPSYVANKKFINAKLKADLQMAFAEADKL
ncbi:MAG: enoyl-CoA hydratase/isomerase family protein [Burkholderiales bacterium]